MEENNIDSTNVENVGYEELQKANNNDFSENDLAILKDYNELAKKHPGNRNMLNPAVLQDQYVQSNLSAQSEGENYWEIPAMGIFIIVIGIIGYLVYKNTK